MQPNYCNVSLYTAVSQGTLSENAKLRQWGREGSRDLFLEFWDPLFISATGDARNFKFGMQIGHEEH